MSKLPKENKFLDLSDYGRPLAIIIAKSLKKTHLTAVHVTIGFVISGLIAFYCIIKGYYGLAAFFLILKSILDAADGELARLKENPSYIGRYLDSVSDILLNILFFISIWYISQTSIWLCIIAFIGLQLQGTLYNYYYVILRSHFDGDTTSRVFEYTSPVALGSENQKYVNVLFTLYKILYGAFDSFIYKLDMNANKEKIIPNWLMMLVSTFGLGFQLLIIACMLVLNLENYIFIFFTLYSLMIFVFIALRINFCRN